MKLCRSIAVLLLLLAAGSVAVPFTPFGTIAVPQGIEVSDIDVVTDYTWGQTGIAYADSAANMVYLQRGGGYPLMSISVPYAPLMVINSGGFGSVNLYALLEGPQSGGFESLYLSKISIVETTAQVTTKAIPLNYQFMAVGNDLVSRDLKFQTGYWGNVTGVVVEATTLDRGLIPGSSEIWYEKTSSIAVFDLQLSEPSFVGPYSGVLFGPFAENDSTIQIISFTNHYRSDMALPQEYAVIQCYDLDSSLIFADTVMYRIYGIASGYFGGPLDAKRIVVHGWGQSLSGLYPSQEYVALYQVTDSGLFEIWYHALSSSERTFELTYPMESWRVSGWSGDRRYLLLPAYYPADSIIIDTVEFDFAFEKRAFYNQEFNGRDARHVLGKLGDSLYDYREYVLSDVEEPREGSLPTQVDLHQNYPNPFNATTEIVFSLPRVSEVSVKVYNLLGEEVVTLADGRFGAGEHRVSWDGTDGRGHACASGIYLYRLEGEKVAQSRKMVLLK